MNILSKYAILISLQYSKKPGTALKYTLSNTTEADAMAKSNMTLTEEMKLNPKYSGRKE